MPGKHEIELFINEDGELRVHIKGIKGALCLKVLDGLVKGMGTPKERELTSEYYQENSNSSVKNKTKL